MGHVHAGSYQLLMNIFVYLTNAVSVAQAPTVTTYLSLLVHVAVVAQIVVFCEAYKLPRHIMLLLVTAWALLPQTYEVWATALNVQWVLGVSVLFIFVIMLVNLDVALHQMKFARQKWVALVVTLALSAQVGVMFWTTGKNRRMSQGWRPRIRHWKRLRQNWQLPARSPASCLRR